MDQAGPTHDDLDVRLRWPQGEDTPLAPPRGRPAADESEQGFGGGPGAREESSGRTELGRPLSAELAVPSATGGDTFHAALAAIALRLDALTSATTLLRNSVSDRLTEYGEHAVRVQAASGRDLEDYRRLNERALTEIDAGLTASEEALHRLERATTDAIGELTHLTRHFDARLDQVQELIEDVAKAPGAPPTDLVPVFDRLDVLNEHSAQLTSQMDSLLARPEPDLSGIDDGLADLAVVVQSLASRPEPQRPDLTSVLEPLESIQEALETLAGRSDPPAVDLAPIHGDLTDLRAAVEVLAGRPDPPPTDLGPLRSSLTELQGSIDSLSSRPVPQPPDLDPIYRVLDSIQDSLAALSSRPEAPDLGAMLDPLDGIQDALEVLANRPDPVATDLTPVLGQLDALQRATEALGSKLQGEAIDLSPVRGDLGELRAVVDHLAARPEPQAPNLAPIHESLADLTRSIEHLAVRPEPPRADLAPIHESLADLNRSIEHLAGRPEPPRPDLAPIHESLADIYDAIDQLAAHHETPVLDLSPVQSSLAEVRQDIRTLTDQARTPSSDLAAIHEAVSSIQASIRGMTEATPVAPDLTAVSRSLGEVEAALDRLSGQAAAIERLEVAVSTMNLSFGRSLQGGETLEHLSETLGRLSEAQAEDLERLLDAIERLASDQATVQNSVHALEDAQRRAADKQATALTALRDQVSSQVSGDPVAGVPMARSEVEEIVRQVGSEIAERLDATATALVDEVQSVTRSIDALRRRIAVRVRRDPAMDEQTLLALTDAVARRLAPRAKPTETVRPERSAPGPRRRNPRA